MASFFAVTLAHGHTPAPKEFSGTAFWIGFMLQAAAAEIWIRPTRADRVRQDTAAIGRGAVCARDR